MIRHLFLLILIALLQVEPSLGARTTFEGIVTRVTDGDTLEVRIGGRQEKVRLIGVDAPEKGQGVWGEKATEFTRERALKHPVRLELDTRERDRYGRLLAYLYVDGSMLNEELVKEGLAMLLTIPPNVRYADRFVRLQREARRREVGIWNPQSGLTESPSAYRKEKRERKEGPTFREMVPDWITWAVAVLLLFFLWRLRGRRRWARKKRRGSLS
ncbi:MAG: thermonuclease family protein [candidate division NC10 bacterium]|nr:thermonuclease family protein [candidate division NC10 bacterium]